MRRSIDPITRSRPQPAPRIIVPMSLRLVIPWQVGLHQSLPPLHQPRTILEKTRPFEQSKPLPAKCSKRNCLIGGVHPTTSNPKSEILNWTQDARQGSPI